MLSTEKDQHLVLSLEDGVRIIRFNRPRRKNAITRAMYHQLTDILNADATNPHVLVTVLTGTGAYYSSGNDLIDSMALMSESRPMDHVHNLIKTIIDYPKLLVALVNGPAIGIAVTTATLCDIIYASDGATFSTPFIQVGLCAEGCSSYTFVRTMGRSRASELLLLGKTCTAQQAYDAGLVARVLPQDRLLPDILAELKRWAQDTSLETFRVNKKLILDQLKPHLHSANAIELEQLVACAQSEHCAQALMKFMERKKRTVNSKL